jgi:hypothetical protein
MAVNALRDPTKSEARALILALGSAWFFTGCAAAVSQSSTGAVSMLWVAPVVISGIWWWDSALSVAPPWTRGWWRVLLPSYFRRASRILGWNETAVFAGLGLLLLFASCLAIRSMF